MSGLTTKTPEHRARELLNLATMARRCQELPGLSDDDRTHWALEAERARAELDVLFTAAGLDVARIDLARLDLADVDLSGAAGVMLPAHDPPDEFTRADPD